MVEHEETKPLGNNTCTVAYGVDQTYTISLPISIDFGTNTTTAQDAYLVVDALVINGSQKLVITMDSTNDTTDPAGGWFMNDSEGDSDNVAYTVKLVAKEGANVTATVDNQNSIVNGTAQAPTTIMTVASNAAGEGGQVDLKFETEGTSQAGEYEDTITFGVSIVDVNPNP